VKAVVIAGMQSGTGKTTVATGLMAALRKRGLRVQPYMVGPDYIDPTYHTAACGRPCCNLDRWLLSLPVLRALFARSAAGADIAVVEGVMGLFDGRTGEGERASTAEVAKALGAPVLLVLDVAKLARTAAALVAGVRAFDPALPLAGVILNRVASDTHLAAVAPAIERETGVPVVGAIRRDGSLQLPERYLGLIPVTEGPAATAFLERAASAIEGGLDLDRLLRLLPAVTLPKDTLAGLFPEETLPVYTRIAVARDRAFHFYYEDSLDLLRAWGAELLPFSPLEDATLPEGAQGAYIGGGFPELFAAELSANTSMLASLRAAARQGMPIYGECGGAMYLGTCLTDRDSHTYPMAGLVPLDCSMTQPRLTLGYRTVTARRSTMLQQQGERSPGHEFHWSVQREQPDADMAAYDIEGPVARREGFSSGSVLASYIHLHLGSAPHLAPRFVQACTAATPWQPSTTSLRAATGDEPRAATAATATTTDDQRSGQLAAPSLLRTHGLPGAEIERRSLAISDGALAGSMWTAAERTVARRLIYAVGDPAIASLIQIHPEATAEGMAALRAGRPIYCDVKMVASGVNRRLTERFGCAVQTGIDDAAVAARAQASGFPRSAEAMLHFGARLEGAVVAIGNAPTALLALLDLVQAGVARPAVIIGIPVGFVAATESKEALLRCTVPFITVTGTRGGTPLAVAAVNALLLLAAAEEGQRDG